MKEEVRSPKRARRITMPGELPEIEVVEVRESYEGGHQTNTIRVRAKTIEDCYGVIERIRSKYHG